MRKALVVLLVLGVLLGVVGTAGAASVKPWDKMRTTSASVKPW